MQTVATLFWHPLDNWIACTWNNLKHGTMMSSKTHICCVGLWGGLILFLLCVGSLSAALLMSLFTAASGVILSENSKMWNRSAVVGVLYSQERTFQFKWQIQTKPRCSVVIRVCWQLSCRASFVLPDSRDWKTHCSFWLCTNTELNARILYLC